MWTAPAVELRDDWISANENNRFQEHFIKEMCPAAVAVGRTG
jgi:hypothetical protein